ncbi:MAG TPA: TIGR02679 family protein [Ktedonobacteraceae bacterium]|nr:TIGR02679 family protein [Ktedonobacteraceae bacterium]
MQKETSPNVERAVTFFAQAGLSRLLTRLREKYIDVGQVGGQIILQDSTPSERREIASFLGKPPYRDANIRVRLIDIDKALQHSGFACTLPDLLHAFFPDQSLVTRPEQRTMHATHQANFRSALLSIASTLPQAGRGRLWLEQGQHGQEWLFSRYKNTTKEEQEQQLALIRYIARVLDQLPGPDTPERLAIFAQRTSGNPHTLDADRAAGRLLLLALSDLAKDQEQDSVTSGTFLQDRAQELRLYNQAGLLIDTISSSVAVFSLAGACSLDGIPDPLLTAAGQRVLLLPLRQIQAWQSVLPSRTDIYLFENPQVFEEVIAHIQPDVPPPTLICTSGWPSVAALTLLDLLMAQSPDNRFHYSGDFDVKGLQIAAYLMSRYPGRCIPWHFDPAAYLQALQTGGVSARADELAMLQRLPDVFALLVAVMQEKGMWAYQEGIARVLVEDVTRAI